MCVRIDSCCCGRVSLTTATVAVAYYSSLMTLALYCLSGAFIYRGITYHERGEYESYDTDATYMMFGCLYLIFAAFWTGACCALFAAVYVESRWLIVPWLVLQVLSCCLGFVNVVCQTNVQEYLALVGLPFIVIGAGQFVVVFSYFMNIHKPPLIVLPYP